MRQSVITLFWLIPALCHGQHTLTTSANAPRAGDSLVMRCVTSLPPDLTDNHQLWDLGQCKLGTKRIRQWFSSENQTDTLECLSLNTRSRYMFRSDTIFHTGHENNLALMYYTHPLPNMKMPMSLGDSISGLFQGWGIYCERLYLRVSGRGHTVADACGTLILPTGDTLQNVLRLRTERVTTLAPIDSIHSPQKLSQVALTTPLSEEEILFRLHGQLPLVTDWTYTWYAPGWRYPVAEMTCRSDRPRYEMIVFLPEDQIVLGYDMENDLRRQAMNEDLWLRGRQNPPIGSVITSHHVNYDEHGQTVGVDFTLSLPAEVSLTLCNVMGVVYHSQIIPGCAEGIHSTTISCAGLPHGQFVLVISAGREIYTDKFNHK